MSALLAFAIGAAATRLVVAVVHAIRAHAAEKAEAARLKRRGRRGYEWRDAKGAVYKSATKQDACEFWLDSYASGSVQSSTPRKEGEPDKSLRMFVSLTGEHVVVDGVPGKSAKLHEVSHD